MVRAVLFDLGNVLVHFSHDRMLRQLADCLGKDPRELRAFLFDGGLLAKYERGQLTTDELYRILCEWAAVDVDREELCRAAADIFWPNPPMEELALRLVAAGTSVVVVSNTCPIHIEWIEARFPFFRRLRQRALSYELGVAKPESAIFHAALELAGASPGEALFFDDTPGHVEAARQLGIQAHRYTGDPAAVHRVLEATGLLRRPA